MSPESVGIKPAAVADDEYVRVLQLLFDMLGVVGHEHLDLMVDQDEHAHAPVGSGLEQRRQASVGATGDLVAISHQLQMRRHPESEKEDLVLGHHDGLCHSLEARTAANRELRQAPPQQMTVSLLGSCWVADGREGAEALLGGAGRKLCRERNRVTPALHNLLQHIAVAAAEVELQQPGRTADEDAVRVVAEEREARVEEEHVGRILVHNGREQSETVLPQNKPLLREATTLAHAATAVEAQAQEGPLSAARAGEVRIGGLVALIEAAALLLSLGRVVVGGHTQVQEVANLEPAEAIVGVEEMLQLTLDLLGFILPLQVQDGPRRQERHLHDSSKEASHQHDGGRGH
mmetsp:Transcript_26366/g.87391  ORF Transcript_26366/g.87391 Transcript_26366/m.87391 type:complete len:347 (+) Transcript_26366:1649-2689(+)